MKSAEAPQLRDLIAYGLGWLRESALPLWSTTGVDISGVFHEQLHFDGRAVASVPRRLMVQARQVATFATAARLGDYPAGRELALTAGLAMCRQYHEPDHRPGWVFSIDASGKVIDPRRDLYAHAFVLFALAALMRLEREPIFEEKVQATLDVLDTQFADVHGGGYWDCLPHTDGLRRQNPHMHLFEALLALYATTGRDDIKARARAIHKLAIGRFFHPDTGAVRELFHKDWTVSPGPRQGSVEPGHLLEWAWLLRQFEEQSGEDQSSKVVALMNMALTFGFDANRGRIIDEIGESGVIRAASSRCWPHTEALKALSYEATHGATRHVSAVVAVMERLFAVFCPVHLSGGWIDRLDQHDRPISQIMPASSLYHIYFGLHEVEVRLGQSRPKN